VTELQGLIVATAFLWIAAVAGLVFLWFNRRMVATGAMLCVLVGSTAIIFHDRAPEETYVAGDHPQETYYHVRDCIHAPTDSLVTFETETEARRTGRVPCRCVRRDDDPLLVRVVPALGHR
jgi:hypothetical protein